MAWSVAIRTVVIDGLLRSAISSGIDTVVDLGAGLDTRPYRMDLPATLRWIVGAVQKSPQENRPKGTPRPHGAREPRIEPAPLFNREAHQQDHQFLDKGKEMVFTSRTVLTTNVQIKRRLTRGTIKKAFFTLEAGPSTGAGIDLDILINGASAINDHPHIGVGESQSTEARLNVPVYDGDEIRLQLTGTLSDATGPFLAHVWIDGN